MTFLRPSYTHPLGHNEKEIYEIYAEYASSFHLIKIMRQRSRKTIPTLPRKLHSRNVQVNGESPLHMITPHNLIYLDLKFDPHNTT